MYDSITSLKSKNSLCKKNIINKSIIVDNIRDVTCKDCIRIYKTRNIKV